MSEVRECVQCGTPFTPGREHARFCSARCRMAWNRERVGVAAAPSVAIGWSVTAMAEAVGRLAGASSWDLPRVATTVGETVWWVTLVDATLVRYHPGAYDKALESEAVHCREAEGALAGLRYVRNQLGRSADPAGFVQHAAADDRACWAWRPLPEPQLGAFTARARQWEMSRYHAYQARLAGRDIAPTFNLCASFLTRAAALAEVGELSWQQTRDD
jgi:hypothetical protein